MVDYCKYCLYKKIIYILFLIIFFSKIELVIENCTFLRVYTNETGAGVIHHKVCVILFFFFFVERKEGMGIYECE
jgi:hypothetical protein